MNQKYVLDTQENKAFLKQMRNELLRFGLSFPSLQGSSYYLGDDGSPWTDKPRETWITCRMAHVYSMGCLLGFRESEAKVGQALKGLLNELKDKKYDGWVSGVTGDAGDAGDTAFLPDKLCYIHAFVILASSSAMLAGHSEAKKLLDEALMVFDKYFWDEETGLACDTWDSSFQKQDTYRGLNSNMHTVEAFLAVADVTGKRQYRIRAGRIIEHVIGWARENDWRIPEHFTKDWIPDLGKNKEKPADPFKPYGATPGHGLEWGRLITQWALSSYPQQEELQKPYIDAAKKLFHRAVADAWNTDGAPGFVYTTDWNGNPVVHDRMHWTLAEAINTASVLYRVTKWQGYADYYAQFMQYLDETVLDHENGSWFHQLDETNHVIGTVWPGKPDLYHAFQATLIPYARVDLSIACFVEDNAKKRKP